ncbi:MAG: 6,7-dimethyl-8-ribityllumazine synthase [Bryobacteraceae bacterium]
MSLKTFEGNLDAKGLRVALIASRFNSFITDRLVDGAMDALRRCGASEDDIELVRVPGSWEMPLTVAALLVQKRHDAIICLGAVIRGETPHFDYIAGETAKGLAQAAMQAGVPVSFGVLTTNSLEQAIDRAGAKGGNKGFDAAMSAVEMANLLRRVRSQAK